jgi:hypothetical protein
MGAQQVPDEFLGQPRSRLVWRPVVEPIPIKPRTVLVTITPEVARAWLRRKISPAEPDPVRARQYAELMVAGLWKPRDDEPIEPRVPTDGVMVADGQHHLAAVVIAGQPVDLLVRMS